MKLNLAPTELIDQLRAWFHPKDRSITLSDAQWVNSKRVAWEAAVSKSLALPGLVGFWPMSSVQRSTGNAYDLSGQGRTLTYNGSPVFNIYNDFAPHVQFNGTTDYLSRADETDLDVQGTETIYPAAVRGLTLGGWFWADTIAVSGLMSKWLADTAVGGSYLLYLNATGNPTMYVVNGVTAQFRAHTTAIRAGTWNYIVGRFVPSTSIDVFLDAAKSSRTTLVPASLNNSTTALEIGAYTTNYLAGRASLCFLCANALSDDLILAKYYQERMLFQ